MRFRYIGLCLNNTVQSETLMPKAKPVLIHYDCGYHTFDRGEITCGNCGHALYWQKTGLKYKERFKEEPRGERGTLTYKFN